MQTHRGSRQLMQRTALLLGLCVTVAATLSLCGCTTSFPDWARNGFKVGPNYHKPPAPLPPGWIDANDPYVRHGDPNTAAWWAVFDDPVLTGLLRQSYSENLTIRAAGFQILQALNARDIARGDLFPQSQSFSLQYLRGELSKNGGNAAAAAAALGSSLAPGAVLSPVSAPTTPIAGVGGDPGPTPGGTNPNVSGSSGSGVTGGTNRFFTNIATSLNMSWELDVWGLFRRNLESANGVLDQSVENYDEMLVLLLANVATQYVEIRTLQKRLDLARKNVAQQEPLVDQYYQRYKTGVSNAFPGYHQLKSNLDNTKALIPPLEISLRQANNQLCVLLGMPIHDLLPELGDGTSPDPAAPGKRFVRIPRPVDEAVVVGIPGNILLRRPDVLAAERELKIRNAQIGMAEAQMYPHIGINGNIGLAADKLPLLFDANSWVGSVGPSLTWNILNYGRLLANVRFQDLAYQQFVAQYQSTILAANQDAENALVAYLRTLDQAKFLKDSAEAATKLSNYLIDQFNLGYLPPGASDTSAFINQLFTALNFQVSQQDAAAQAEGNIALDLILVYRAMGGGWQIRCDNGQNQPAAGTPTEEQLPSPMPLPKTPPGGQSGPQSAASASLHGHPVTILGTPIPQDAVLDSQDGHR